MKTNKIILATIAIAWIFSLSFNSLYAMWNWQNQGNGMWKWNWWNYAQMQNKSWTEAKQSWHSANPEDLIMWVELQDLDDNEKNSLYYSYSEEMLAHDIYTHFYELYWVETFNNIASSEAEHMTAVKVLLDRYNLNIPSDYWILQETYETLKKEWEQSLQKALEVWVKIEMLDIDDIKETIKTTDNIDFKIIFTHIWWASYNHLRWFLNWLKNNWLSTTLDYSSYLTEEEVATKWGTLKTKMAQSLESEWFILPEQASSENIKAMCDKENQGQGQWQNQGQGQSQWNMQNIDVQKAKYSESLNNKYAKLIDNLSETQAQNLLKGVDDLLKKVNEWNYSIALKQKYIPMLLVLQDIILEKHNNLDTEINSLFDL